MHNPVPSADGNKILGNLFGEFVYARAVPNKAKNREVSIFFYHDSQAASGHLYPA